MHSHASLPARPMRSAGLAWVLLALSTCALVLAACDSPGAQPPPTLQVVATASATPAAPQPSATPVGTATALPSATASPTVPVPSATSRPPSPTATALPPTVVPMEALSPFGVSVRGELYNQAVQKLLVEAKVTWARTSVSWQGIQPKADVFNWDSVDDQFLTLTNIPVTPIVYVAVNPGWAAASACGPINRANLPDFARFVSALAGRYNGSTVVKGRTLPAIYYWQFYNEPDNQWTVGEAAGYGGCWGSAGAEYAQMLEIAWTAVHTANPAATVLFGGIAGERVDCPESWSCSGQPIFNFKPGGGDFLDDALGYMQTHPTSRYFDVFDFHFYPAFHYAWDQYGPGLRGKAEYYKARLARWGMERPLMCGETGRRSDAKQVISDLPGSDEEQSRYVVRLYTQALSSGLSSVMWFTLADVSEGGQAGSSAWGLLTQDGKPKRSYATFKTMIGQLGGLRYQGIGQLGAGIEAYRFAGSNSETTVLWSTAAPAKAAFTARALTVVDMAGKESTIADGGPQDTDKKADGTVTIVITLDPLYVRASRP